MRKIFFRLKKRYRHYIIAYEASDTIKISSTIEGSGTTGANISIYAGKEVELSTGLEIEVGAELFIKIETCGEPY